MKIDFDPAKDAANLVKHGIALSDFQGFDTPPVVIVDDRYDYGETRFRAFGRIGGAGFCLVYCETARGIRAISFRRAHDKEMQRYA
ncbi:MULTISPECIES: BrnT family toxin [unclassified Sphingomonas]|uniref:BrnT family toxin n=1 Tax=unclassified Sphingomonas TaxID=196159 RepID=UPI000BD3F8AF|nr:MAG: hypothetical protein B7Z43_08275 [Sphingomonas sp. 12-62-6]OYX39338.1 MAG: hypothetical protein B7Y98_05260 [Sphingomonas sp. 32-62-10]OYY64961.1 MAG: hypothetical protein B7Y49_07710 [Sphingomonas sp. 28-62-11]